MANSHRRIFVHIIWSTKGRAPILRGTMERFVLRRIREIADDLDLDVFAANGAWSHLHTLVAWNTSVTFGEAIRQWKSRTSREWNHSPEGETTPLRWQRGAGIFSVAPKEVEMIRNYVFHQKRHHRDGTINAELESW